MINLNNIKKKKFMSLENSFELDSDLLKDIEAMVEGDEEENKKLFDSGMIFIYIIIYLYDYYFKKKKMKQILHQKILIQKLMKILIRLKLLKKIQRID